MWSTRYSWRDIVLMALLALACGLTVRYSTVRKTNYHAQSDPFGSLLVSQSLIQHGTLRLDAYGSFQTLKRQYPSQLTTNNNHTYYLFPLGSSLLAVPFVAVAHACGLDMQSKRQDWAMQGRLVVLTVSLLAVLIYAVARVRLEALPSACFSVLFVLGTSLASTCGTAFWSFNGELVFMLIALFCLLALSYQRPSIHMMTTLRLESRLKPVHQHRIARLLARWCPAFRRPAAITPMAGPRRSGFALLLGLALFMAYLCRPSALAFGAGCMAVLLSMDRRAFWLASAVVGVCFLAFVAFSVHEYGTVVPPYYQLSRLSQTRTFATALLGNLISPSRGWLVFSPFVAVILIAGAVVFRKNARLFCFAYGVTLIHLLAVSRFPHWWGGHSFGPRLLTDAAPCVLLIGVLTVSSLSPAWRGVYGGALLLSGLLAIGIHTGQGLYNTATLKWNYYPNVDEHPEYVFDWRCPQCIATPALLEARMRRHTASLGSAAPTSP